MPTYEYRCESCGKEFTRIMRISEHEKGGVHCPNCNSDRVVQQFSTFYAKTSRKS